jgi:hypothetical protein
MNALQATGFMTPWLLGACYLLGGTALWFQRTSCPPRPLAGEGGGPMDCVRADALDSPLAFSFRVHPLVVILSQSTGGGPPTKRICDSGGEVESVHSKVGAGFYPSLNP